MPFKKSANIPPETEEEPDDEVAPEVPTSFATKGVGWSGRESDGPDVKDLSDDN